MLRRFGLVIVLCCCFAAIYAQADSLFTQAKEDTLSAKPEQVTKAEIMQWIEEHQRLPFVAPSQSVPLQYDAGDLYQSNYLFIGRPDLPQALVMGFEQPVGAFSPALYHGYYLSFYPRMRDFKEGYDVEIYPYAPALSYIKGGLGEYEHHFARAGLMKNKLFGLDNFYYQGDLLAQNGLWTDLNSAETSHKHYLSIPLKNFKLNAEYAAWNKDVGMAELLPAYWQTTNFLITHRMNHVYASLENTWGELALLHSEEKAKALPFSKMLESKSTQLRLAHRYDHGPWKYLAAYERAFRDANFDASSAFGQSSYKDKFSASFSSYPFVGLDIDLQWLDWKRGRLHSEVLIPVRSSFLGAYYRMKLGKEDYQEEVQDIYNPGSFIAMMNLDTRREQAAFFRYEWQGISSLVATGSQQVKQYAGDSFLSFSREQPFFRLGMDVDREWGAWQLSSTQRWSWYQQVNNLCESPEFSFQSVQNLIYHLSWGNTLLAGFSAYGHSGYNVASLTIPYTVEGSTALDAWLGLGIESRFDFQVGMKNLLGSTLYGAAPVPLSLFAQLSWYYLN
ncbi:MAG: hypothetical protein KA984_04520 [Candidatus Cloacimonetes bacterium]|nr:hypothetical protein [Candidatus Cloacimonadota bacterium]